VANRLTPIKEGIQLFRDAGMTKVQSNGNETFWCKDQKSDPDGKRCYCVVTQNMTLNEVVCMTPKQAMWIKLKYADAIEVADWTDTFNIHPDTLRKLPDPLYGKSLQNEVTFEDIMQLGTLDCI